MRSRRSAVAFILALTGWAALSSLSSAEVVQKGDVRVKFEGALTPKALPRDALTPVKVGVGAKITALDESDPPKLRKISIAINSAGKFSPSALPVCTLPDIQPSTTANAFKACGGALVGTGTFAAKILLPQQASFPAGGKLYAFNGRYHGRPAILAHVYGTDPVPTSFTLPFVMTTTKGSSAPSSLLPLAPRPARPVTSPSSRCCSARPVARPRPISARPVRRLGASAGPPSRSPRRRSASRGRASSRR